MKVLGCTGGIGSGKSYVCRIFSGMGVPVYYSDDRTKDLYDSSETLKERLADLLGTDILHNGVIDRKIMAGRIFSDSGLLQKVEEIVHPAVMEDFEKWREACMIDGCAGNSGFVIFESALLLQKPLVRRCADKVMVVSAPKSLRIERIKKRDNISYELIERRMAAQMSDEQMKALADFIIVSNGRDPMLPQVENIYNLMKGV